MNRQFRIVYIVLALVMSGPAFFTPLSGQTLSLAEYFFDTDPGFGNGTAVPLSGTDMSVNFDANMSGLSPGVHTFYIRTQDSDGRWSETAYKIFYKPLLQGPLPDLVKAEYFFDTDPGFGNGTAVPLSGTDMTANFNADMSTMSPGIHTFYIRTQDSDGRWSETAYKIFYKPLLQGPLPDLVKAEYFFDTDPGFGNGTEVPLSGTNMSANFDADMSGLSPGVHTFYIRTQDSDGRWSETAYKIFYKPLLQGPLPDLARAEYFFDTDPGFGNGTSIPLSGTDMTASFDVETSALSPGVHLFYIRAQDADGRWSETAYKIFSKPLLQGPLPDLVKAEYYYDTDPGFGNGTPVPLSGNNIVANFTADLSTLFPGVHQLYIRTQDTDGRWSETAYQSFTKEMTIVRMEYYFDTDPGYGNATGINYSGTDVRIETTLSIDMTGLTPGFHYLYLRSKDYAGGWSETAFRSIYIPETVPAAVPAITYAEYYLNTDPGYGNGISIPVSSLPDLSFEVCLDNAVIGSNRLFVRSRDADGRWSETAVSAAFTFNGPNCPAPSLPVTVSTTSNSALISWRKTKCTENYQIQYKEASSSIWQSATTVDTFYTLSGLTQCASYEWQVSANCSPLISSWTGTVNFTTSGSLYYQDSDGDGYGNSSVSALLCPPFTGYVTDNTDCDDANSGIHPGAQEVCNTLDDDCNGSTDAGSLFIYYADTDIDGYGNKDEMVTDTTCIPPMGYVADSTDCDDGNLAIYPGAAETCNLFDDDCDTQIDEGVQNTYYADTDSDGYGDNTVTTLACTLPLGYASDNTDCDPINSNIHPGATETCNLLDDDCDTQIDEGVQNTYYADADSDGYGNIAITTMACYAPTGYVADSTDCNDADQYIYGPHSWYFDGDSDGWHGQEAFACSPPSQDFWSEFSNGFDCDDDDIFVNGYAVEIQLNGIDDNCNGLVDEACLPEGNTCDYYITRVAVGNIDNASNCSDGYENFESLSTLMPPGSLQTIAIAVSNAGQFVSIFIDFNGDHILDDPGSQVVSNLYVAADSTSTISFVMPSDAAMGDRLMRVISSYVENGFADDPCSPYPGEVEDYTVQIACSATPVTWYQDLDGDTFGNDEMSQDSYCQPPGYVSIPGDCDDSEAAINPDATDIGDSGVDENCNGIAEDPCTPVINAPCFNGYITEVSLGAIQNATGCDGGFSDYTYLSTPLEMGDTATISLTSNSDIPIVSIFIDFNDNEILDDTGERVATIEWLSSPGSTLSFEIPYDIIPGPHRMRILGSDNPWGGPPNPCGPHFWGEAEDYTLNILCPSQAVIYYYDADGDGYGDPDSVISITDCHPVGYVVNSMDCDDTNFDINPGVVEIVDNMIDDDCNGVMDELTYCDPVVTGACSPDGSISIQRVVMGSIDHVSSCEVSGYGNYIFLSDTIPAGAVQEYSLTLSPQYASFATIALLLDMNRDGDFYDLGEFLNYSFWYSYLNGPVINGSFPVPVWVTPGNYTLRIMLGSNYYAGACSAYGGEVEDYTLTVTCPVTPVTYYADSDGDGYGDPASFVEIAGCMPEGYVLNNIDCNDMYSEYHFPQQWYQDLDGDLFHGLEMANCTPPAGMGWSLQSEGLDCDDTNGDYHTESYYYLDADGDGYYDSNVFVCIPPVGNGWSGEYGNGGGDCDDADPAIHPGTEIFYNGLDDNCDGLVDTLIYCDPYILDDCSNTYISQVILGTINQGSMCSNGYSDYSNLSTLAEAGDVVPFSVQTSGPSSLFVYIDYNHNGYWYESEELIYANQDYQINMPFTGSISLPDSLTDGYYRLRLVAISSPFADPCFIYDGEMEDYSIQIENLSTQDADNDGYFASSCGGDDCDDNENTVYPGAIEVCNTIDEDCDGNIDEGVQNTYYSDTDGDGYGDAALDSDGYPDPAVTILACAPPVGYVSDNTDCNDTATAVNPGAAEICNGGADDNCNGLADNADPGVTGQDTYYEDNDGDGFGDPDSTALACTAPPGYVTNNTDCDDMAAAIYPGTTEICNNIDDNCDLVVDDVPVTVPASSGTFYSNAINHLNGTTNTYMINCNLLAQITDAEGGNILGNTNVASVLSSTVPAPNTGGYIFGRRKYTIIASSTGPATLRLYFTQADFDNYNSNNNTFLDLPATGNNADLNKPYFRIARVSGGTYTITGPLGDSLTWNGTESRWEVNFPVADVNADYYFVTMPTCDGIVVNNLQATQVQGSSIVATWDDLVTVPTNGWYGFQYRTTSPVGSWIDAGTANGGTTSKFMIGFTPGTAYELQIRRHCSSQSTGPWSNSVFFTTLSPGCSAPPFLTVSSVSATSGTVTWPAIAGAGWYAFRYSSVSASGPWTSGGTLGGAATSKTFTGLTSGTTYHVQARTYCASNGQPSTWGAISFSTTAAEGCALPPVLTATIINATNVTVSWPAIPGTGWFEFRYRLSPSGPWISAGTLTGTAVSKMISGLTPGTIYDIQARSFCASNSQASAWGGVTVTTIILSGCELPPVLTATSINATNITVSWPAVSGAAWYEFRYRLSPSGSWISAGTVGATTVSKLLSGLQPNAEYDINARTFCSNGQPSAWGGITVTTIALGGCELPPVLTVNAVSANRVAVTWPAIPGAGWYEFRYSTNASGPWTSGGTAGGSATSKTITGLSPATTYYLQARSFCSNGLPSAWSSNLQFMTSGTALASQPEGEVVEVAQVTALSYTELSESQGDNLENTSADLNRQNTSQTLLIYPNPTRDNVNLVFDTEKVSHLTIVVVDMIGRILQEIEVEIITGLNVFNINLEHLPNGMYMIQLREEGSLIQLGKVQKLD